MEIKKMAASVMAAALMVSSVLSSWAEAPASQLSQAQAVMGSNASAETKLDVLYNGGSAKQLGVAVPAPASSADGARHLDIGAAPAGSALDQASVPAPTSASAQNQARVGYWDGSQAVVVGAIVLFIAAAIIISANQPRPTSSTTTSCSSDGWGGYYCTQNYYGPTTTTTTTGA